MCGVHGSSGELRREQLRELRRQMALKSEEVEWRERPHVRVLRGAVGLAAWNARLAAIHAQRRQAAWQITLEAPRSGVVLPPRLQHVRKFFGDFYLRASSVDAPQLTATTRNVYISADEQFCLHYVPGCAQPTLSHARTHTQQQ